jgi:hypothetical protein
MSRTIDFTKFTARQILTALVDGLRKPHYNIDMGSYGSIKHELDINNKSNVVCYACAATNAITSLTNFKFKPNNIIRREYAFASKGIKLVNDINKFEIALDMLRKGFLNGYNNYEFATIDNPRNISLPYLKNDYTEKELLVYESLIEDQIPD